jgi:hypothetical protein
MITPRAPKTPFVGRLLRGISSPAKLDKAYRILDKMFKPIPYRFKHKVLSFLLRRKYKGFK